MIPAVPAGKAALAVPRRGPGGMRARAVVEAEVRGGRTVVTAVRSQPPLTVRQTGPEEVHLVATAAGPLDGDHLELGLRVRAGARLTVRAVAATLVLPGESVIAIDAVVEPGATLAFLPQPTILAAGCRYRTTVWLSLAEDASVTWREEIVLGRYGEATGRCHARFDAVVDGRPLLRQDLVIGDPAVAGPAVYGAARCVGSLLLAGAARRPRTPSVAAGRAVLPLAGPGTLIEALAPDAPTLRERLTRVDGQS